MVKKLLLSLLACTLPTAESRGIEAELVLGQPSDPAAYKDQCPSFRCNDVENEGQSETRYLSQQVYCHKSDFASPLTVLLKDCQKEGDMYCNGPLNRCMLDPYAKFSERLPGNRCEFGYECLSRSCQDGVCKAGQDEGDTAECSAHADCNPGFYCRNDVCTPQ